MTTLAINIENTPKAQPSKKGMFTRLFNKATNAISNAAKSITKPGFLSSMFKKVASALPSILTGAAAAYGIKAVAMASIGGAGGAVIAGLGVTGYQYWKDRQKAIAEGKPLPKLLSKKYGLKLAFNMVGGAIGADLAMQSLGESSFLGSLFGAEKTEISLDNPDNLPIYQHEWEGSVAGFAGSADSIDGPPAAVVNDLENLSEIRDLTPEPVNSDKAALLPLEEEIAFTSTEEPTENPMKGLIQQAPEIEPIVTTIEPEPVAIEEQASAPTPTQGIVETISADIQFDALMDNINTDGWDTLALESLEAAQRGAPWAVQNLADFAANGSHGIPVNLDLAESFANISNDMGNPQAPQFLADIEMLKGLAPETPIYADAPEAVATPAIANEVANTEIVEQAIEIEPLDTLLGDIDTDGWNDRAIASLEAAQRGAPWAVQDLAHFTANGLLGDNIAGNRELAHKFANIAAEMGSPLADQFLIDNQAIMDARSGISEALIADVPPTPSTIVHFASASEGIYTCDSPSAIVRPGEEINIKGIGSFPMATGSANASCGQIISDLTDGLAPPPTNDNASTPFQVTSPAY